MSGQKFTSFLPRIRDRGMELFTSWQMRYGTGKQPEEDYFELWSITPLWELTSEDLLWALVAAAQDPFVTHLCLYVYIGTASTCPDPDIVLDVLIRNFVDSYGFMPLDVGEDFLDGEGEFRIILSLFSEDEGYFIQDILYRN